MDKGSVSGLWILLRINGWEVISDKFQCGENVCHGQLQTLLSEAEYVELDAEWQ